MNIAATLLSLSQGRFRSNIAVEQNGIEITYASLGKNISRLANSLKAHGLREGDVVAGLMSNRVELLETQLACSAIGVISAFIGANSSEAEIEYALQLAGAKAFIYDTSCYQVSERIKENTGVQYYIAVGAESFGDLPYANLLEKASDSLEIRSFACSTPHSIHFTSGTTGRPKGVLLSYNNWLRIYYYYLAEMDTTVDSKDVALMAAPVTHANGALVMPTLQRGGKLYLMDKFDAPKINHLISTGQITSTFMAPTMIQLLMKEMKPSERTPGRMKTIAYGGASFPVERLKEALDIYGPILVQGYGQWEAPMGFTMLNREGHIDALKNNTHRLSSAGLPTLFSEVAILNDDGHELGPNAVGEIATTGPHLMLEYYKNPEATAEIRTGRWQRTGDIGHIDEDGYVYVTDRKKDMIISGGMNVYPRQIEEILYENENVQEVCVIGIPDELWGETVHAVVVRKANAVASELDLINWTKQKLKSQQRVRSVSFVDQLPKNSTGKVLRREVRQSVIADQV